MRVLVILIAVLAVTGCQTEVDTARTEETIANNVREIVGANVDTVECPEGVEEKVGATFECTVTAGDGTTGKTSVRVTDDKGNLRLDAPFINKRPLEQSLLERYAQQNGYDPTTIAMDCPEIVSVRKGDEFVCEGERLGKRFKLDVTQTNDNAKVDFKEQP